MSKQRKSTMIEMVTELKKMHPYPEVKQMIAEAEAGEYHDYKNEKYDCGKVASMGLLQTIATVYPDQKEQALKIRSEILAGTYDEVADEEDKKKLAKGMPENMKKILGLEGY